MTSWRCGTLFQVRVTIPLRFHPLNSSFCTWNAIVHHVIQPLRYIYKSLLALSTFHIWFCFIIFRVQYVTSLTRLPMPLAYTEQKKKKPSKLDFFSFTRLLVISENAFILKKNVSKKNTSKTKIGILVSFFHNIVHVRNIRDFIIFIKEKIQRKICRKKIRRNENHFKRQPNKTDNNFSFVWFEKASSN